MEKKLKRGLAELSELFLSGQLMPKPKLKKVIQAAPVPHVPIPLEEHELPPIKIHKTEFAIEPPTDTHRENPSLICSSFFNLTQKFSTGDFLGLLERLDSIFTESYLFSVTPTDSRYRELQDLLFLPEKEALSQTLFSIGNKISFGYLNEADVHELMKPRLSEMPNKNVASSEKSLVVFDLPLTHSNQFANPSITHILDLLDHAVFIVEANTKQLAEAYQLIRFCFAHNPMLRPSILLVGEGIDDICDSVYDRFSMMISKFLGCDLGFLGWADENEMRFNADFLLEEGTNSIRFSSKARLKEALYAPVMA